MRGLFEDSSYHINPACGPKANFERRPRYYTQTQGSFEHSNIMNRVSHFIAIAVVTLCFSTASRGGEIQSTMQPIGQVVTTTTVKTVPSEIIIGEDGIRAIGTRYQLLKGERDKAIYRDLQTGHKIRIEIHD
jgi:hypothetical protein